MKRALRHLVLTLLALAVAGCGGSRTIEREIGYKGKARTDPYLAAERFLQRYSYAVESRPGWPKPDANTAVMVMPVSILNAKGFIQEVDRWVQDGGHLICLGDRAEAWRNDWNDFSRPGRSDDREDEVVSNSCREWLENLGLTVGPREGDKPEVQSVVYEDRRYEISAGSTHEVTEDGGRPRMLGHADWGQGRVTFLADARPLRNRYINEHDHAALLLAMVRSSPYSGTVLFVRDASLSFGEMLWHHGWPALLGLAAVVLFWLWKNMPRFGPLAASEEPTTVRAYDHHLEALGDFHWRLDKAAGLLRPLRESLLERAHQHAAAAGHRDGDLFEWLGQRAGIGRERAQRAMTQEQPQDPATFTRVLEDLQTLHLSLT